MAPPPKIAAMIWWNLISPPLTMAKQNVPIPTSQKQQQNPLRHTLPLVPDHNEACGAAH